MHPELLLYKIALYIQSECFLKHLFDFYYGKRDISEEHFTGGITDRNFRKIKYTALDYKIIPINYSLRQLINGSWLDVDKLDYIARDAFFMGLEFKSSEFRRIIHGIHLAKITSADNKTRYVIAVDYKLLGNIFSMLLRRELTKTFIIKHRINKIIEKKFIEYLKLEFKLPENKKSMEIDKLINRVFGLISRLHAFRKSTDFIILNYLREKIKDPSIRKKKKKQYELLVDLYCALTCRGVEKAIGFVFIRECDKKVLKSIRKEIENTINSFPKIKGKIQIECIDIDDPLKSISKIHIFDSLQKTAYQLSKSMLLSIFGYKNQNNICLHAFYLYIKNQLPTTTKENIRETIKGIIEEIKQFWNQLKQKLGTKNNIEIVTRYA